MTTDNNTTYANKDARENSVEETNTLQLSIGSTPPLLEV